jgi:S1-C subfamily serine protease
MPAAMGNPDSAAPAPARSGGWLAAGAGLAGVVLGGVAVMLGHAQHPVAPAPAPVIQPVVPPAPTLVDAVARTRASVVSLRTPTRAGAGVIVDAAGIVVTNMHVVGEPTQARAGEGPSVRARFADGREVAAIVVVADRDEDLAVLRLVGDPDEVFEAAQLGESARLRVGEAVFAIGNPHGLSHSVTSGVVAALDRTGVAGTSAPLIQLDASINVGNSGGPLFTFDGRLVGIVAARERTAEGIAFALPVDHVRGFLRAVTDAGGRRSGALGIQLGLDRELPKSVAALGYQSGLVVENVVAGGAAHKAGLQDGDVLVEIRGARLDAMPAATDRNALARWFVDSVRATYPGERLELALVREGEIERLGVEIGAATERDQAFIDAEVLLGVRLDHDAKQPTITGPVDARGLGRYGQGLDGGVILGLLGRDVADVDALGAVLGELRGVLRSGGGDLIAWVRIKDRLGQENVWPITVR